MKRYRCYYTCRICGPRGVHHYPAKFCQNCGGRELVETIGRPSLAAMIDFACNEQAEPTADEPPKRQRELFA